MLSRGREPSGGCCYGEVATDFSQVLCFILIMSLSLSLPELRCFQLHHDGRLIKCPESATIALTAPPWSCAFDWSDNLWVCLPDEREPLVCYKPEGERVSCNCPCYLSAIFTNTYLHRSSFVCSLGSYSIKNTHC